MKRSVVPALAACLVAAPAASALAAEPSAEEILKLVDKAQSDFTDLTTDSKLVVREPGQTTGREYQFVTISKGNQKRLVRFLSPGDVKGMGMLIEGNDTMYAYLPGFDRVRRLGTHVKNQAFMGSDVATEDMAGGNLADIYDAKKLADDGTNWVLELHAKPGRDLGFPARKVWVDKTVHQMTRIEDYDAKGALVRTTTRTDYRKDEGSQSHYTPFKMTIVDHRRNDHATDILMLSAKANQNVGDDVFSQRSLIRGR